MPGSHSQQINEIAEVLIRLQPLRLLDVGVGFGKYGVLAREYLDLWAGADKAPDEYRQWQRQVDGIEAYAGYLTPLHSFVYNQIHLGDAREVAPKLTTHYDLTLLVDVVEHLSLVDGLKLLRELRRHSRNLLISTPKIAGVQGPLYGNNFERHISEWRAVDFQSFADRVFIPNQASLICFIGEDVEVIRRLVAKKRAAEIRAAFRTLLPFLVRPYRRLKALVQRK